MYSNLRLLDCINEPKALIDKAIELGYENEFNLISNNLVNLNISPIRHLYVEN